MAGIGASLLVGIVQRRMRPGCRQMDATEPCAFQGIFCYKGPHYNPVWPGEIGAWETREPVEARRILSKRRGVILEVPGFEGVNLRVDENDYIIPSNTCTQKRVLITYSYEVRGWLILSAGAKKSVWVRAST